MSTYRPEQTVPRTRSYLHEDSSDGTRPPFPKRQRGQSSDNECGRGEEIRQAKLRHEDYTVGWICALPIELRASCAMLDSTHENMPSPINDGNQYILGNIGQHNVVLACLPAGQYGTNNAAIVASNMMRTFTEIQVRFVVGIGGGVPGKVDIRLGDVVVGDRVIQHDLGRITAIDGFRGTGFPRIPPLRLLQAVSKLRGLHESTISQISSTVEKLPQYQLGLVSFERPTGFEDQLFRAEYSHAGETPSCLTCNPLEIVVRPRRFTDRPYIHYGGIASGNQVVKCGQHRDSLANKLSDVFQHDVICFEMEAAGLMDTFPCIVIRGICDYSDSHKNKAWQGYAAATAAAYARELLSNVAPDSGITAETRAQEAEKEKQREQHQRHQESLRVRTRRVILLQSLSYEQIHDRRSNIATPRSRTCGWILQHPLYKTWLDHSTVAQHHGFLWISGKPGAGKSTLMKFAFGSVRRAVQYSEEDAAILCFFFNARGVELEKSLLGMYRSLLHQLLGRFPKLQEVFDDDTLIPSSYASCPPLEVLRDLFRNAVMALQRRHLTCFIDALDECDETQVREMVVYFEELGEEAIENDVRLNICFSSRHYPHIDIRFGLKLMLEKQTGHSDDLKKYVQGHLRAGVTRHANDIQAKVLDKAGGVFMWVVLVVDILNKELVRGRGRTFILEKRLNEIPAELSDLFQDILRRDRNNMDDFVLCVQWILFAKRPLELREFYFAMMSVLPDYHQILADYDPNSDLEEGMELLVTSSSKGLAEVTKTELRTVQFIHESVRDFLVKDNGLQQLLQVSGDDLEARSHEKLKSCCLGEIGPLSAVSAYHRSHPKVTRTDIVMKFPFLIYATENVLNHAEAAAKSLLQDAFMDQFPLEDWARLTGLIDDDAGTNVEDSLLGFNTRKNRYLPNVNLTYILAENNLLTLLEKRVTALAWQVHSRGGRYGYPLFAAMSEGHLTAAKALLGKTAQLVDINDIFPDVRYDGKFDDEQGYSTSPLRWALENNHGTLANYLISQVESTDHKLDHKQPICYDVVDGNHPTIRLLVENTDPPRSTSSLPRPEATNDTKPNLSPELERFSRFNVGDIHRRPRLSPTVESRNKPATRLLLDWGSALHKLAHEGRVSKLASLNLESEITSNGPPRSLLERGLITKHEISIEAVGCSTHDAIELLVDNGENISMACLDARTLLEIALRSRNWVAAKYLIGDGHIAECTSSYGHYALHHLHLASDVEMAKMLLENGATIKCGISCLDKPLQSLAAVDVREMIELFIKYGVDLNYRDRTGRTPLHEAVCGGHTVLAKLLIQHGAAVDSKDVDGRTPFHDAVSYGYEDMARILIMEGATTYLADRFGRTPLQMASQRHHKGMVDLLLQDDSGQTRARIMEAETWTGSARDEEQRHEYADDEASESSEGAAAKSHQGGESIEDEEEEQYFTAVDESDSVESSDENSEI